jgi:hypothetical protein
MNDDDKRYLSFRVEDGLTSYGVSCEELNILDEIEMRKRMSSCAFAESDIDFMDILLSQVNFYEAW